MHLSLRERATLHFYQWELQKRGYYLFDTPVDIEPPYHSFKHITHQSSSCIDDGRVPSLLQQARNLLKPKIEQESVDQLEDIQPRYLSVNEEDYLFGFSISVPKNEDISPLRNMEFLNMLSYTSKPVSFEILGTSNEINIQWVCSEADKERLHSLLNAYFSNSIIQEIPIDSFGFDSKQDIAIADFGLSEEFMIPTHTTESFSIDPLIAIIGTLESLKNNEISILQILLKGITSPLAKDIIYSVSDGKGGSFFDDNSQMVSFAKQKIESPLYTVVMRIATQGDSNNRSSFLAQELVRNISIISTSTSNKLIPLSNEGYNYDFHLYNLHHRLSNRLGFILNSKELNTFVHYPSNTIVSNKLNKYKKKTKKIRVNSSNGISIGTNTHDNQELNVRLRTKDRLSHTHIIGATGVGKSTLIANMLLQDISEGTGCALFDPHGDIVEDILVRIPEYRKQDIILIDPSDIEFPIGFNLLEAHTEAERIVLSSDLVSVFKRYASAWGDNMTSVLQNTITTILESTQKATLIELKRFLVEEQFRNDFLLTIDDPTLQYYWKNEYPMLRKGISPLLTRIDTFLRSKIIRYMLAQKSGVDFRDCLDNNKILLIKLSHGLIGEENSYLMGSLFLTKLNQDAMSRQSLQKEDREPYFIYIDEFQNFITPSISKILSGARKYGLGLTLAHQDLSQIEDPKILNSVLSNPYTRICFRLGDNDSKRLESGFEFYEQHDLQSLGVGEAIVRIGSSSNDFNLTTHKLSEVWTEQSDAISEYIIANTRSNYAKSRYEIETILRDLLPKSYRNSKQKKDGKDSKTVFENKDLLENTKASVSSEKEEVSDKERNILIEQEEISQKNRDHSYLQNVIKKLGQERGYLATIEKETKNGGRIDIALEKGSVKLAFEISITNTAEYEVKNIKKCLSNGYLPVFMVSKNRNHLDTIKKRAKKELSSKDFNLVFFIQPNEVAQILDGIQITTTKRHETIKGFRITTEFEQSKISNPQQIREHIAKLLFKRK